MGKRLVRGIHNLPSNYELASAHAAIRGLMRTITVLDRLAKKCPDAIDKRELNRAATTCGHALSHITGGFDVERIQPLADRWTRLISDAAAHEEMLSSDVEGASHVTA